MAYKKILSSNSDGAGIEGLTMFRGRIVREAWHRLDTSQRRGNKDTSTRRMVFLPEKPNRLAGNVRRPPEIGVEYLAGLRLGMRFNFSYCAPASVVEDDIDAPEYLFGFRKGVLDILSIVDVESNGEELA